MFDLDLIALYLLWTVTTLGFLAVGLTAAWGVVRSLEAERGPLGDRDLRWLVAAAAGLFVVGFARVVGAGVVGEAGNGDLALLALGFGAMTYLYYRERPGAFDVRDGGTDGTTDDGAADPTA
jgi:hypothetical protein